MLKQAQQLAKSIANNGTQGGEDSLTLLALHDYLSPDNIRLYGMNELIAVLTKEFKAVKRSSMRLGGPNILLNTKPTLDSEVIPALFAIDVIDDEARPGNYDMKVPLDLSGANEELDEGQRSCADKIAKAIFADGGRFTNAKDEIRQYFSENNLRRFGVAKLMVEMSEALLRLRIESPVYELRLILTGLSFNNGNGMFELHTSSFEEGMRDGKGRYGGVDSLELPLQI